MEGRLCEDTGWWRPWISQGERPQKKPTVTSSSLQNLNNCCCVSQPAVVLCSGCPGKPRWRVLVKTHMCLHCRLESHPEPPSGLVVTGWTPRVQRGTSGCSVRWAIQGPVSPSLSGRSVWEIHTQLMNGGECWIGPCGPGAVLLCMFHGLKSGWEKECSWNEALPSTTRSLDP